MKLIFEKQGLHYSLLIILLAIILIIGRSEGFLTGRFLGIGTSAWFYLAISVAILHQVYVWFCWRIQLHYSLITRRFGRNGFLYYSAGFAILIILRILMIVGLAIADRHSLPVNQLLLSFIAAIMALPALYLFYSVKRYFTFKRALGIDHFDQSYRHKPLVREGIFRFSSNSMYTFGLLILWIPGLLYASSAALLLAVFNHVYVWVHYYSTERPDMKRIYGPLKNSS